MKLRVFPKRVDVIALWNVKIQRAEEESRRCNSSPGLLQALKDELRMLESHGPEEIAMEIEE